MRPLLMLLTAAAAAMEPGDELVRWSPMAPSGEDQGWDALAAATVQPLVRYDGVFRCEREDTPVDGVVALRWQGLRLNEQHDFGQGWARLGLSAGTDPWATEAGRAQWGASMTCASSIMFGLSAAIGWSEERESWYRIDAHVLPLSIGADGDGDRRQRRIGLGWRQPGGDGDAAFRIAVDYVTADQGDAGVRTSMIGGGYTYRMDAIVLAADAALVGRSLDARGAERGAAATGSLALGVVF